VFVRRSRSAEDQLARLADGSIDAAERARLEQTVASSPKLAALLAEQRRALGLTGAIDLAAPASLLERVATGQTRPARSRSWRRPSRRGVLVIVAAVVLLVVLASRVHAPTVRTESHFALDAATLAAPGQSPGNHAVLSAAVAGVAFPDWSGHGWSATGARNDTLDGRGVETVFYRSAGYARVGYSIVAGGPLSVGTTSRTVVSHGVAYSVIRAGGASVVTWLRDGHTCVLASDHTPASALLALAQLA
jgi:anti-sigma factor RsiW